MSLKTKLLICRIIFVVAFLNFAVFIAMALRLGGDAISGKIENGHYYLSNHGRLTEVTEAVYNYSKWHTYSVWITHPLAFVAAFYSIRLKKNEPK